MEPAQYLAKHPLFQGLSAPALQRLARMATPVTLRAGEILALAGDPCEAVYLLAEGRVRAIVANPQGREQVVTELEPGEPFYLVPALDGAPLPVTTQAATRASLLRMARADFIALLGEQPGLCLRLLRYLAERLRALTGLVERLSLFSVPQRLAGLLLERADAPADQRLTQREMAARLGTVREVVARALAQFAERGWLRLGRGSIEILDAAALRDLVAGGQDL